MYRKFLAVFFFITASLSCRAQVYLDADYSGATITHPGLQGGYGRFLINKQSEELKGNELLAMVRAGFYFHRDRHTGVYGTIGLEWIRTSPGGFQFGFELPVGYLRTFIPKVYELTENGDVNNLGMAGTNHLILSPALRLGHTISSHYLNSWFIKNRVMIINGYVGGSTQQYMLEAGVAKILK
jgi:hypothetical protein